MEGEGVAQVNHLSELRDALAKAQRAKAGIYENLQKCQCQIDELKKQLYGLPCDSDWTPQELVEHLELSHGVKVHPDFWGHMDRLESFHDSARRMKHK